MRITQNTIKGIAAGLLLGIMAICAPVLLAQSYNPTQPGSAGGYDNYGNSYPGANKQILSTGSMSFLPTCFYWNSAPVGISIATPAVITVGNNCAAGQAIIFSTSSALPTGLTAGTTYYIIATGLSTSGQHVRLSERCSASDSHLHECNHIVYFGDHASALPAGVCRAVPLRPVLSVH
jgi:hypothetical protein